MNYNRNKIGIGPVTGIIILDFMLLIISFFYSIGIENSNSDSVSVNIVINENVDNEEKYQIVD